MSVDSMRNLCNAQCTGKYCMRPVAIYCCVKPFSSTIITLHFSEPRSTSKLDVSNEYWYTLTRRFLNILLMMQCFASSYM